MKTAAMMLLVATFAAGCAGSPPSSEPRETPVVLDVGSDITPGTYRATPTSDVLPCYWERRLRGPIRYPGGVVLDWEAIASADILSTDWWSRDPSIVTILPGDGMLYSFRCSDWVRVADLPSAPNPR